MTPGGRRLSGEAGRRGRIAALGVVGLVCTVGMVGMSDLGGSASVTKGGPATRDEPAMTVGGASATTVPVLLVPGWFDSARELAALRIHLLGVGWPGSHVAAVDFREPTGSNRDHADELEDAVEALLQSSGSSEIDIVAHSMGGLATRWYLLRQEGAPVRRVVFLASPHRGTLSAHLAWGGGREEMMPGSPFLDTLNTTAPTPPGVEAITVRTLIDTHIVPGESATLPDVPDYPLCCPTHSGLLRDPDVFEIVRSFLESGTVSRAPSNGVRP